MCREATCLDSIYSLYPYTSDSILGRLIQQFKYHHQKTIQEVWKKVVVLDREKYATPVVIPVPLFRARERDRDYNQSAVIAGCLGEKYSLPLDTKSLVRVRATKQQATLSREERYKNVQSAFVWQGGDVPKEVLLVDDVFTTGATLEACARALKEAGVEVVHGFTLATGGKQ
jgi:ComF family protein